MKTQTNGWRKITKRSPSAKDFPIIAGSYRGHRGASHWSLSSVFESRNDCGGWDSDRTHFFSIPLSPDEEQRDEIARAKARNKRLTKIGAAKCSLEDSLLELRKVGNPTLEQDRAFSDIYYLVRLARKSK